MPSKSPRAGVHTGQKRKPGKKHTNRKPQNKKSYFAAYACLFIFVFIGALLGLNKIIQSYSPEVTVSNTDIKEKTIQPAAEPIQDIKPIDSRLRIIQMEDELPTVSIKREDKAAKYKDFESEFEETEEQNAETGDAADSAEDLKPPMPSISSMKKEYEDFRSIPAREVIQLSKQPAAKVYLGYFASYDEAASVQAELVKSLDDGIIPFVKQENGRYIVQLGSFSDSAKAEALTEKIRAMGYYPKINYENPQQNG